MMNYYFQNFLFFLVLVLFADCVSATHGLGHIGTPQLSHDSSLPAIDVDHVRPNARDDIPMMRRALHDFERFPQHLGTSGSSAISLNVDDVKDLWHEVDSLLLQLSAILLAAGINPNSAQSSLSDLNFPTDFSVSSVVAPLTTNPSSVLTTLDPSILTTPAILTSSSGSGEVTESIKIPVATATETTFTDSSIPSSRDAYTLTSSFQTIIFTTIETDGLTSTISSPINSEIVVTINSTSLRSSSTNMAFSNFSSASFSTSLAVSSTFSSVFGSSATASTAIPSYTSQSTSSYTFDRDSESNVAVYYGQTSITKEYSLESQCSNPSVDIAILAFVIENNYEDSGYPLINFGAACGGQTSTMESEAPGLLWCPSLASNISNCQENYGKKVLLSLGGATGDIAFSSALEAENFATKLWQLFGPTGDIDDELRPFGNIVIDGFDVDNEDNEDQYWDAFGVALRTAFESDSSKTYYLSAAPQCPYPDASDPTSLLVLADFVWVQFYNNEACQIGSSGFNASIEQWSEVLQNSTLVDKPRVYLGAPAFSEAGSTAYASFGSPSGFQSVAAEAKGLGLENFGGVMFWDGPEGTANTEDGKSILDYAKAGLEE